MHKNKQIWHIWLVALFFLFIYANGIYDYFMMLGQNVDYYNAKGYGELVYEYFTDYPIGPLFLWTINVVTGLLAPILLLLRTKWAMRVGLISFISMLGLQGCTFFFMNRWEVFGPWISIFDLTLLVLTFLFFYYCRWLVKLGKLR